MNIYSDDRFCSAVGTAYYPGRLVKPTLFRLGDQIWRLPALNGKRPVAFDLIPSTCIDFYEPLDPSEVPPDQPIRNLGYLPKISHGLVPVSEWSAQQLEHRYMAGPTILLDAFPSWQDFLEYRNQHHHRVVIESRRRRRRLEEQFDNIEFIFNDRRLEAMGTCMRLKAAQYDRTRGTNLFVRDDHVRLFKTLAEQNLLVVSSLNAGEQILAVHMGLVLDGRMYWWIPAYDVAYNKYAPGRLLLELCVEESYKQGHREFDFMIGGESFKWHYATHTRLIGDLGTPPLHWQAAWAIESAQKSAKAMIRKGLEPFPKLLESVERARQPKPSILSATIPGSAHAATPICDSEA